MRLVGGGCGGCAKEVGFLSDRKRNCGIGSEIIVAVHQYKGRGYPEMFSTARQLSGFRLDDCGGGIWTMLKREGMCHMKSECDNPYWLEGHDNTARGSYRKKLRCMRIV